MRHVWSTILGAIALTQALVLLAVGPRHAFTALWTLSANHGVDTPFTTHVPLVILNPALALALALARWRGEGKSQGAQRTAPRAV
ncbi:hypothetical protein [Allorhizocola rhizosphaerae]|uniref:hypothetical protein n=1 Tax=Allorhizocola rhizosphaerae TaxID=1872709 RepID=UPI000E3D76EC|nr:hypothetical protein [Allorhizocola rhizosphaerae]